MDWRYDYQLDVMTRAEHWLLNEDMRQKCELFRIALQKIEAQVGRGEIEAFLKSKSPELYDLVKWVKDKSRDFHRNEIQEKLIEHFKNNPQVKQENRYYFVKQSLDLTNHPENIRLIAANFPQETKTYIDRVNIVRYAEYLKTVHHHEINDPDFIKKEITQVAGKSLAEDYRTILVLAENNPSLFKKCYQEMNLTQGQKEDCELTERVALVLPTIQKLKKSKFDQAKVVASLEKLADADSKTFGFCQFHAKKLGLSPKLMDQVKIPNLEHHYDQKKVFKWVLVVDYSINYNNKDASKKFEKTVNKLCSEDPKLARECIEELPKRLKDDYNVILKAIDKQRSVKDSGDNWGKG